MKKQIALVLTVAALAMSACEPEVSPRPTTTSLPQPETRPEPVIYSMYPNAGAPGSILTILGQNFGPAISDNYVTFGSTYAEVTYVGYGVVSVRIPNLADGDYEINLRTNGQVRRVPLMFTIINSEKFTF